MHLPATGATNLALDFTGEAFDAFARLGFVARNVQHRHTVLFL
jgi:hypothetical protein